VTTPLSPRWSRPISQAAHPHGAHPDDRSEQQPSPTKEIIVLVVEDNVSNFVLIARLLGYLGIHCEWKTSGYEVVEYADTLPHLDLILMDIRLPYEDGYAALKKIRGSSTLKDALVIAVTAEASIEQLNKARLAQFDGFIGKPLDPDRFPDQIRRILAGEQVWELS
jgi:two-component system cell cycle response regulator DivK